MERAHQVLLVAAILIGCWLGMQAVHEAGHVLGAWAGRETVSKVVLHPLTISRTDVTHERHPLLVCWGGATGGVVLPLVAWGLARWRGVARAYLLRFFAGFCLIANGAYLGVGAFDGDGDAGDLMRYGAPRWTLVAFGVICAPAGLWLWHGLGRHFGMGGQGGRVDRRDAYLVIAVVAAVGLAESLLSGR